MLQGELGHETHDDLALVQDEPRVVGHLGQDLPAMLALMRLIEASMAAMWSQGAVPQTLPFTSPTLTILPVASMMPQTSLSNLLGWSALLAHLPLSMFS